MVQNFSVFGSKLLAALLVEHLVDAFSLIKPELLRFQGIFWVESLKFQTTFATPAPYHSQIWIDQTTSSIFFWRRCFAAKSHPTANGADRKKSIASEQVALGSRHCHVTMLHLAMESRRGMFGQQNHMSMSSWWKWMLFYFFGYVVSFGACSVMD